MRCSPSAAANRSGATVPYLRGGPHLVAPTGTDLDVLPVGTTAALFHYDLNLITLHGKANAPGLYAWDRDGHKFAVRVPDGRLLVQAGRQLEILTGGAVRAGFHEVMVEAGAREKVRATLPPDSGLRAIRTTTTWFGHAASRAWLQPLGPHATETARRRYGRMRAWDQVAREIKLIGLDRS